MNSTPYIATSIALCTASYILGGFTGNEPMYGKVLGLFCVIVFSGFLSALTIEGGPK